jgi:hypothetical protein
MKTYLTYDIKYDFSGGEWSGFSQPKLPQKILIDVPDEIASEPMVLEDYLADKISDKTGFCVEHFDFQLDPFPQK